MSYLPPEAWITIGFLSLALTVSLLVLWRRRLKNELLQKELRVLTAELAKYREKNSQLEKMAAEYKNAQKLITELQSQLARQLSVETRLKTILEKERQTTGEKLDFLEQAHAVIKSEFQNLAQKIFEEKSSHLAEHNRNLLDSLLTPLQTQLAEFKKKVEDVYDKESRDRAILADQIERLKQINERIGQDAINLTRALKGDSKVQGTWGEVILERVLEASGLTKGREYHTQVSLRDESGRMYRPDAVIHLPDGKDIIVDAKVSLRAYQRYYESRDDPGYRAKALSQHAQALKNHVRDLAQKNYSRLQGIYSLDFILMFLPMEAAFLAAVEHDPNLFSNALEKGIIIVSPSTLLVTLRTIENIWRREYQNRHALEIARQAAGLHDKFVGFVESLMEIGDKLDKAKDAYLTAYQRLVGGRGNLVRKIAQLKQLGVKAGKELPDELLDAAMPSNQQVKGDAPEAESNNGKE